MQTLSECLGEELYSETIENSVINIGFGEKLKEIFKKEKIKLAFLGASITCGYSPNPDEEGICYVDYLKEMLEQTGKKVDARNYAVSGTNCFVGLMITQLMVKDFAPDIIFLEYAINEESYATGLEKFESLVRMSLKLDNSPVVIPVSMFDREGYSCEGYMLHFAKMYGVPMTGFYESVYNKLIKTGRLPLEVYTEDKGHPHPDGHKFIAKAIMRTIERSIQENISALPLPEPMTPVRFENFHLLDIEKSLVGVEPYDYNQSPFKSCWKKVQNGNPLFLETDIECSQILVMYVKGNTSKFAVTNVISDGEKAGGFSGHSLFGWNNPWFDLVMSEDEKKMRHIRFETEKGDENKELYIIAVAYC